MPHSETNQIRHLLESDSTKCAHSSPSLLMQYRRPHGTLLTSLSRGLALWALSGGVTHATRRTMSPKPESRLSIKCVGRAKTNSHFESAELTLQEIPAAERRACRQLVWRR